MDGRRGDQAGADIGFRGACIFIFGDLMEHATSLGFPSVASATDGCTGCHVDKEHLLTHVGVSLVSLPFEFKTVEEYDRACKACEIQKILSRRQVQEVRAALQYDRKPTDAKGTRGRSLVKAFPELGLNVGDRLESSDSLPCAVVDFDEVEEGTVMFWRRSSETMARRRNPLIDASIGLGPRSCMPCWLHALSLGAFKVCLMTIFWDFVAINAWRVPISGEDDMLEAMIPIMQQDLFSWYASEEQCGRMWTHVQRLSSNMFGTRSHPNFGFHGAEVNGLLHWFVGLMDRFQHEIPLPKRNHLRKLLDSSVQIYRLIRNNPETFDLPDAQASCGADTPKTLPEPLPP